MTPLLLVPGMMCDARMWGGVPARAYPRHVAHALPVTAESMAALARDILRNAPPRFALAGLSMGGIIAMEILAQAPERVERLALLDTNPCAEAPDLQGRRLEQITRALKGGLAEIMRHEMKPNYLGPGTAKTPILDLCMNMALSLGAEVFRRQSLALRGRADRREALAAFKGPALVLMGEHDRLCPKARHQLMHQLMPQSRFVTVPGAGHLPTLENPRATWEALLNWLEV